MKGAALFSALALSGCFAELQADPFASHANAVSAIASLGGPWSAIDKIEPEVSKSYGGSVLLSYELDSEKSVNIDEKSGKIIQFVLFDGKPDAEGHCKGSFQDRSKLSEGLARITRESDVKDAQRRYKHQIDNGLDKGLQVPAFNTPRVELRAWSGMNCRIAVGKRD